MHLGIFRAFHNSLKMLKQPDFYTVLGVPKSANESEIKSAYFSLAKKLHPDINKSKDAKEKFSLISTAYETLGDKSKRHTYDRTGLTADEQEAQTINSSDIEDFVEQNQPKKKGSDIKLSIELTFLQSISGCEKSVSYEKLSSCSTCKGSRAKPGTSADKCSICGGYGVVLVDRGSEEIQIQCEKCAGLGKVVKNPCGTCKGQGLAMGKVSERVLVPPGVENGFSLKLQSKGNASLTKGDPGDLVIKVLVQEHGFMKRKGFDLYSSVALKASQAVLGGVVEIETVNGKVQLEVNPGLRNCENVRLSKYGVPHLPPNHSSRGDHYISFQIKVPKKLSQTQQKIFEALLKLDKNQD